VTARPTPARPAAARPARLALLPLIAWLAPLLALAPACETETTTRPQLPTLSRSVASSTAASVQKAPATAPATPTTPNNGPAVQRLAPPRPPAFEPRPPAPPGTPPLPVAEMPKGEVLTRVDPAAEPPRIVPLPAEATAEPAAAAASDPVSADTGLTAADVERHVRTLSSDAMAGRDTGTPESLAAAAYIAGVLQRAGLQPAGDDGGFLQATDVLGVRCDGLPALTATTKDGSPLPAVYGADFTCSRGHALDATLPVIVVRSAQDIPSPPRADAALMLAGTRQDRQKWFKAAGNEDAKGFGLLLVTPPGADPAARGTPIDEPPHLLAGKDDAARSPLFTVRGPLRDKLLAGEVTSVHATIRTQDAVPAANVVGILPGAGTAERPELAQQAIVFTAHYDHLGTAASPEAAAAAEAAHRAQEAASGAPPETEPPAASAPDGRPDDRTYNGADDDASGVAAVLELAEAFGERARGGERPARTLVFLLVTGEERGLIGTEYYLDHPVVPLERTICNLNFEMIGRPDPLVGGAGRLWLTGFERTNLGPAWAAAGLPIEADARPSQHFYERSDNIAFVERGIVGQSLSTYNLHTDYHTVRDEADRLDFAHMEGCVRASFAAAKPLADGTLTPEWTVKPKDGGR